MNDSIAPDQPARPAPALPALPAVRASFFDLQGFELMQRVAKAFAASTLVPDAYKNNVSNCMIAFNLADRLKADVLMVMQNLNIVYERPSWSSQFLIASFNQCGRFSAMRYEFFGEKGTDGWGCRAWAIEKETGERLTGADVTLGIARAEGWVNRKASKWPTMPQQMLIYRAASWMVRAYAPEITMGLPTSDELADIVDVREDGSYSFASESRRAGDGAPPAERLDDLMPRAMPEPAEASPASTANLTGAESQPAPAAESAPKPRRGRPPKAAQAAAAQTRAAAPSPDPDDGYFTAAPNRFARADNQPARAASAPRASAPAPQPDQNATNSQPGFFEESPPAGAAGSETPPPAAGPIPQNMLNILARKMEIAGRNEVDMRAKFGHGLDGVTRANYNALTEWAMSAAA